MRTKNLTPFLVGHKVCARKPPQREMALIVRGRFSLGPGIVPSALTGPLAQGAFAPETFPEGDDDRTGDPIYPGDFADFKRTADLLLRGFCHPPAQVPPGGVFPVAFAVGGWSKALEVRRPEGRASGPADTGLALSIAPFGPVSSESPDRKKKRGKAYGDDYRKTHAPFQSADFDWTYHQAAPEDQRLSGYLVGDEELSLLHLFPGEKLVRVRLPGLRVRALVKGTAGNVEDRVLALDTLFVEPEERRFTLTWRGHVPVAEDDLSDVRFVVVATERLSDPPSPREPYLEELAKLERDPRGLEDLPPDMKAGYDAVRGDKPRSKAPPPEDPLSALLDEKLGGLHEAEQARVREVVAKVRALRGPAGTDIDKALRQALSRLSPPKNAAFLPTAPGGTPMLGGGAGAALAALVARLARADKDAAARGQPPPGGEATRKLLADPRLQKLLPGYRPDGEAPPPVTPGPGVDLSGQDLSNADLAGRDLTGANFTGALLVNANLSGAKLVGANFTRAVLFEADLTGADLSGADLTHANAGAVRAAGALLESATLEQAIFTRADLSGARLVKAHGKGVAFQEANLSRADATEARFEGALFEGATLEDAVLRGATLTRCMCPRVKAARVDLEGASLPRTAFSGGDLQGAKMGGARGERAVFLDALLDGADLAGAAFPGAHFSGASARGSSFASAVLSSCRFHQAALDRADFGRANLFEADFAKAALAGASFAGASLYGANLAGAGTRGADFRGANLKRARREPA